MSEVLPETMLQGRLLRLRSHHAPETQEQELEAQKEQELEALQEQGKYN